MKNSSEENEWLREECNELGLVIITSPDRSVSCSEVFSVNRPIAFGIPRQRKDENVPPQGN